MKTSWNVERSRSLSLSPPFSLSFLAFAHTTVSPSVIWVCAGLWRRDQASLWDEWDVWVEMNPQTSLAQWITVLYIGRLVSWNENIMINVPPLQSAKTPNMRQMLQGVFDCFFFLQACSDDNYFKYSHSFNCLGELDSPSLLSSSSLDSHSVI